MNEVETLAAQLGPRGEVRLRRRTPADGVPVEELIVNGVFAMDSTETFSERALGDIALAPTHRDGLVRVLVGGLGLGYTVLQILEAADRQSLEVVVDVVEIEPSLVDWALAGLTTTWARIAGDERVRLHAADIGDVLGGRRRDPVGPWDAILLDVDNGPDFLIHGDNAALYAETGLRAAYAHLADGGTVAVWCQGRSEQLLELLSRIDPSPRENRYAVTRGERQFEYVIYTISRPSTPHA